jgi:hypothetical protein
MTAGAEGFFDAKALPFGRGDAYAFGVGRRLSGAGERFGVPAVDLEEIFDLFDALVGERHYRVVGDQAVHPDDPIFSYPA